MRGKWKPKWGKKVSCEVVSTAFKQKGYKVEQTLNHWVSSIPAMAKNVLKQTITKGGHGKSATQYDQCSTQNRKNMVEVRSVIQRKSKNL